MFLPRTSCHKITHANSFYGAWPGWTVSISGFSLTEAHLGAANSAPLECLAHWASLGRERDSAHREVCHQEHLCPGQGGHLDQPCQGALPQIPRASLAFTTEPVGNGGFEHGEWASLSLDVDIEVTMALRQAGRGHPQLLIHGPLGGIVEKAGI